MLTTVHPGVPAQPDYSGAAGYRAPGPMIVAQLAAPSRRMSPAAIVVAVVLATMVIIEILAAIAIPVFINQRAKAAAVTLGRPDSITGLPIVVDAPENAKLEAAMVQMRTDARVKEALGLLHSDAEGVDVTALRPRVTFSVADQARLRTDSRSGAQRNVTEELMLQKEDLRHDRWGDAVRGDRRRPPGGLLRLGLRLFRENLRTRHLGQAAVRCPAGARSGRQHSCR